MKKLLLFLFVSPLLAVGFNYLQICNDINAALKSGNYKSITAYISNSLELNLPGNEGLYSKPQSETLIKDFFAKNTPKNYTVKHEGNSKDGSRFVIGTLETNTGSFRTYFYVKNVNNQSVLKELRIEKE